MTAGWVLQNVLLLKNGAFGCTPRLSIRSLALAAGLWSGLLLEAHLVGRLAFAGDLPTFVGCGINELELWQLWQTLE